MRRYNAYRYGRKREILEHQQYFINERFTYDYSGQTAGMVLCQYAHWDLLKEWIAVGGDIWAKDEDSCTLLSYVLRSGRASAIGAIEYLESLGLRLASEVSSNGRTPLMLAAASCRQSLQLLRYVLARGFAMDARDKRGRTPLLYACEERSLASLRLLLRRGARLDEEAYGRCGALYWASAIYRYEDERHRHAWRDKDELLRFLIQSGLDINHRRRNGRSLIFDVCDSRYARYDTVQLLIAQGADIHVCDDAGVNLLMALCRHDAFEDVCIISEFLFEPKPPERDWVDERVLILRRLVELGLDPHARDAHQMTVLDYAQQSRYGAALVQVLQELMS